MVNMDNNGIRFGTIYVNSLDFDPWEEGKDISYEQAVQETTKEVTTKYIDECNENDVLPDDDDLDRLIEDATQNIEIDEPTYAGETDGVRWEMSWLGGAPLLWILHGPHITKARLCSPCVPNAGDLNHLDSENGYECYNVPDDWRRE